jgi:hypothetical protein
MPRGLSRMTEMTCTSNNAQTVDQSHFWTDGSVHSGWDAHRVGCRRLQERVLLCCVFVSLAVGS